MFEDVHDSAECCLIETGLLTQATARAAHPREWRKDRRRKCKALHLVPYSRAVGSARRQGLLHPDGPPKGKAPGAAGGRARVTPEHARKGQLIGD